MKGPDDIPPIEAHCYRCGGELTIKKAEKKLLRRFFSRRWQWHIDTVCSGCGMEAGSAIARYTYPSAKPHEAQPQPVPRAYPKHLS